MKLSGEEEEGGIALNATDDKDQKDSAVADQMTAEEVLVDADVQEMTSQEIDSAFRKAFLYGVRHYMDSNKDQHNFGLDFPLTQSFVMSGLVQPFLPAFSPAQVSQLQIKNSSYKSIKKFIKSLDKEQMLKAKDRQGNEVVVVDIDFRDRAILEFVPYKLPKKETTVGTSQGRNGKVVAAVDVGDESIGQTLKTISLYKPKDKLSSMFNAAKADPRAFYSATDIRRVVTTYIETENLISQTNKRLVNLNPALANDVLSSSNAIDGEVIAKGAIPRDALIDRVLSTCSPYHCIIRNDDDASSLSKPKAGVPPKLHIVLETRSGNKTVTRISGLEAYYINPQLLADELRKACASNTSVDQLVGSSPKNPVMEVMVQGPQKDTVIKALGKRGVQSGWVEVTDKTKKR